MSYGFTPYDKKSYKQSKKRRKQALLAEKTGRILPIGTAKRRIFISVCVLLSIAVIVFGSIFIYNTFFTETITKGTLQETVTEDKELLTVVNKTQPLESTYTPDLVEYKSFRVNPLMLDDLISFVQLAKEQNVEIELNSAYISFEEQSLKYSDKLNEYLNNPSYTLVRAEAETQKLVPKGGCSEAQTGLLVGFDVKNKTTQAFIDRYCVDYGFIQRYTADKEDITRVSESSSLYRYVGKDNAIKMRAYQMCLEEYFEYVSAQNNN